jgi:hypothetical protein
MKEILVPDTKLINKSFRSHYLFFLEPFFGIKIHGVRLDTYFKSMLLFLFRKTLQIQKDEIGIGEDFYIFANKMIQVIKLDLSEQITKSELENKLYQVGMDKLFSSQNCFIHYSVKKLNVAEFSNQIFKLKASVTNIKDSTALFALNKTDSAETYLEDIISQQNLFKKEIFILISKSFSVKNIEVDYVNLGNLSGKVSYILTDSGFSFQLLKGTELYKFVTKSI